MNVFLMIDGDALYQFHQNAAVQTCQVLVGLEIFDPSGNKKSFRQAHAEDIAKYEEALCILKQHSPDGRFPTMKDLRTEKEQLTIQKDAQYDTYHYFKDYHRELQTVCANVDNILGTEREAQREQQKSRKNEHSL